MTGKSIKLIGLTAAISALLIVPAVVLASFNYKDAVVPNCTQDNKAELKLHFENDEQNDSLNVSVKDNVSNNTIDMGSIGAGKSQDSVLATNLQSIQNGTVTFTITKDGSDDKDTVNLGYAVTCGGEEPTSTPTLTPEITNTPTPTGAPTTLIVKKHVVNNDNGTESAKDFTIFVKDVNADKIYSQSFGSESGTSIPVNPGVLYSVYEGTHDGYDLTFDGDCSTMVNQGETKTCILTNDDIPGFFPTATPTNTLTPTPTNTNGNNNCDNTNQSGNNDNNNCNQQNQNQNENQTQNNNQNVNITLNQPAPQVLGTTTTTQLPSTGTPFEVWELLGAVTPLGFYLRKITKK